jgi:hypothetical protein
MKMPWSSWVGTRSEPRCDKCGWHGEKGQLIMKKVGLETRDSFAYPMQILLASPPSHRIEYHCPICKELLASDLKFMQSYYDQETFPD